METTCWTPTMRNGFITTALTSEEDKGNEGYYWYNVLPKHNKPDEEDPKKAMVTNALMTTIFQNPEYRMFALKIYDILRVKIMSNPYTRPHYQRNICVMLKGGTAYTYLLERVDEIFPYSDLDIVIYINPYLTESTFNTLKDTLSTIVLQTISQYKRAIDFMFFSNKEKMSDDQIAKQSQEQFMSDALITQFKEDYNEALSKLSTEKGTFVSPFEGVEFRNAVSKHSFIIADSKVKENAVVRVEVPHFDMCERIPLRKTPLFCSYNKTIRFNRMGAGNEKESVGSFDLYRIRFNNLYMFEDEEDGKMYRENITADFIDISIPNQEDAELMEFYKKGGRAAERWDKTANISLVIPDGVSITNDLYKMLYVYECPDAKKERRLKKYEVLSKVFGECKM